MAEYIEKQAAIDALGEEPEVWSTDNEWEMGAQEQWRFDHAAIKAIPPADVRPVRRGLWIVRETAYEDTEARCSECGFTTLINEPGNGLHMLSDLNYCPNCGSYNGADMRGGDADGDEKD